MGGGGGGGGWVEGRGPQITFHNISAALLEKWRGITGNVCRFTGR